MSSVYAGRIEAIVVGPGRKSQTYTPGGSQLALQ